MTDLILFRYIYPGKQSVVPTALMKELTERLAADVHSPPQVDDNLCRGPFLSHTDYHIDVDQWGYRDARGP